MGEGEAVSPSDDGIGDSPPPTTTNNNDDNDNNNNNNHRQSVGKRNSLTEGKKNAMLSQRELDVTLPPVGVSQRKCTDVLFLITFILFWIGQLAVAIVGFENGDPRRLVFGSDHAGRICGGEEKPDKMFITYPRTILDAKLNPQAISTPSSISFFGICVESCPVEGELVCTDEASEYLDEYLEDNPNEDRSDIIHNCITDPFAISSCPSTQVSKGCFDTLFNTTSIFFRCLPEYVFEEEDLLGESGCVDRRSFLVGSQNITACVKYKKVQKITRIEPTASNLLFDSFNTLSRAFDRYLGDIFQTYPVIMGVGLGLTAAYGMIYVISIWFIIGPIVWGSVIGCVLVLLAFTIYCYVRAGAAGDEDVVGFFQGGIASAGGTTSEVFGVDDDEDLIDADDTSESNDTSTTEGSFLAGRFRVSEEYQEEYQVAAYLFSALTVIAMMLILGLADRINRAIAVFKEASNALRVNVGLVFLPVLSLPVMLCIVVFWGSSSAYVASAGELRTTQLNKTFEVDPDAAAFEVNEYISFSYTNVFIAYLFFGMLWSVAVLQAIVIMVVAGTVGAWYWKSSSTTTDGTGYGSYPILRSIYVTFRFHLGSVAFGSLLVAIMQMIRYIAAYIESRVVDRDKASRLTRIALSCVHCILKCMELCIKYISRNAFIHMAMYGDSFCPSTYSALLTLTGNLSQVALITFLGDIILRFGQVFLTILAGLTCWAILDNDRRYQIGGELEVNTFWWPTFLTMLLAWFASEEILGIYDICIDTILLNYCQDIKLAKARKKSQAAAGTASFRNFVEQNGRSRLRSIGNTLNSNEGRGQTA